MDRLISAQALPCLQYSSTSLSSSSSVHLSFLMLGLTLCRHLWAHCCPLRPAILFATSAHLHLPSTLGVQFDGTTHSCAPCPETPLPPFSGLLCCRFRPLICEFLLWRHDENLDRCAGLQWAPAPFTPHCLPLRREDRGMKPPLPRAGCSKGVRVHLCLDDGLQVPERMVSKTEESW